MEEGFRRKKEGKKDQKKKNLKYPIQSHLAAIDHEE